MEFSAPRYLSSLESSRLKLVRTCTFQRGLAFDTGKDCVLARLDPPLIGQDFGISSDVEELIIVDRHEGHSILSSEVFPQFVFVARMLEPLPDWQDTVEASAMEIIGWGELYRSAQDAECHRFDT